MKNRRSTLKERTIQVVIHSVCIANTRWAGYAGVKSEGVYIFFGEKYKNYLLLIFHPFLVHIYFFLPTNLPPQLNNIDGEHY